MAVMQLAAQKLQESFGPSVAYDAGKELEIIAGLLQDGFHSKSLNLSALGFRLLTGPSFVYVSSLPQRDRGTVHPTNAERASDNLAKRLTNDVIACVGQAYVMSAKEYGELSLEAAMGAVAALPFTTISMRLSDLQSLRADCLFYDADSKRWKISIYRPKLGKTQILRIPRILGDHANNMISRIRHFTQENRNAFAFYERKFGNDFSAINELYIPEEFSALFNQPYFRRLDLPMGDGSADTNKQDSVGVLARVAAKWGIEAPLDFLNNYTAQSSPQEISDRFILAQTIIDIAKTENPEFAIEINPQSWISETFFTHRILPYVASSLAPSLRRIYKEQGKLLGKFSETSDLRKAMLKKLKERRYPYWPFSTSDRRTRLSECLLTFPCMRTNQLRQGGASYPWWIPMLLPETAIRQWIGGTNLQPIPTIFRILDIHLPDGTFPRFDVHETRKYFQTNALLAGVSLPLIDEQSGRKTGRQSAHYDRRTIAEHVKGSIECFDPNDNFQVFGRVNEESRKVKIVDRRSYIYKNAAPKQLTEVGGCSTDWSMNPCPEHGACMSCESSVWRKGDIDRLPRINYLKEHSMRMISKAEELIANGAAPEPIIKHQKQHRDVLSRCNEIIAAEADSNIPAGSLVTFPRAAGRIGTTELASLLREENLAKKNTLNV